MKIVRKTLVRKTTRILPPLEMPLPPALMQFIQFREFFKHCLLKILQVLERKERRKEKEKGNHQESSKNKKIS